MKTLIAIPCMSMVHTEFMASLMNLRKAPDTSYVPHINSLVYDSRNVLTATALNNGYDRVLWLDSDMKFEPDLMERLSADMDTGLDFVSGLYFTRRLPSYPVIYSSVSYETGDAVRASAVPYKDYPRDSLFEIEGSGFGGVMTSCAMLKRVWEKYGAPFDPLPHMGEDLSFCWRLKQMGGKMYCDSRVKLGHVGTMVYDEAVYLSQTTTGQTEQADKRGDSE